MQVERERRNPRSGPRREWSRFGPLNFAVWLPVAFLLFLSMGALMKHLPPDIPLAYTICSLVSGWLYAHDKSKARREAWRTPESALHLLDLLGGWPGGLIAQRIVRHKTRKTSFQVVFWLGVVVHIAVWGWIFVKVPAEADFWRFLQRVAGAVRTIFAR